MEQDSNQKQKTEGINHKLINILKQIEGIKRQLLDIVKETE